LALPFLWVSGIKEAYKGLLNGDILEEVKDSSFFVAPNIIVYDRLRKDLEDLDLSIYEEFQLIPKECGVHPT